MALFMNSARMVVGRHVFRFNPQPNARFLVFEHKRRQKGTSHCEFRLDASLEAQFVVIRNNVPVAVSGLTFKLLL